MSTKKKATEAEIIKQMLELEGEDETPILWVGGKGSKQYYTVARNRGEAINNIIEKEPILAAIGCEVEPFEVVEGCTIAPIIPEGYVLGDDRRRGVDAE